MAFRISTAIDLGKIEDWRCLKVFSLDYIEAGLAILTIRYRLVFWEHIRIKLSVQIFDSGEGPVLARLPFKVKVTWLRVLHLQFLRLMIGIFKPRRANDSLIVMIHGCFRGSIFASRKWCNIVFICMRFWWIAYSWIGKKFLSVTFVFFFAV